jgi:hypothetical protein
MRVEIDEANNLVAIEPETPEQRDSLLRALLYPVPLNPEDMRDVQALHLADHHVNPVGGTASLGRVELQFERVARDAQAFDPDRHLRPLRVPTGELLTQADIEGTWRFAPSAGAQAPDFTLTVAPGSVLVMGTDTIGMMTGEWYLATSPDRRFTGSADGRSGFFMARLSLQPEIWVRGAFVARGEIVATYTTRSPYGSTDAQVRGTKA